MTLVYQAYGRQDVLNQTYMSVTSLLSLTNSIQVLIYTDHLEQMQKFFQEDPRVQLREISPEELKNWRGEIDFVHRVKIGILEDASKSFNASMPDVAFNNVQSSLSNTASSEIKLGS